VAADGEVQEALPLPIAGLMSDEHIDEVRSKLDTLHKAAAGLGCRLEDVFSALSFLSLPVVPALKLTDRGLVDSEKFKLIGLFESP
jgi:adenine deaminase